ncbi:MAG TPA: ATP-binding protein [Candidatus Binatia bacterium]|nr:ATP-binding protein [Candidatus Binatia bacterium]
MKLGTKLIFCLVATLMVTMLVHGYWSIQQDRENIVREMRVGMTGLSRSIQAALRYIYGDAGDIQATQNFVDGVARAGNIHGVVVYNRSAEAVVTSVSLTDTKDFPHLDPAPVLEIDPRPVLASGNSVEGYVENRVHPVYFRIEPILDSRNQIAGAFVLGRRGTGYNLTLQVRRNRIILTTFILIALLTSVILVLVRRNVSRPISELIDRISAIGEGHWEKRIEVRGKDEISSLAVEFNQMCQRLEDLYGRLVKEQQDRLSLERGLRQSDKLASIGQLAAGLAHEIGTPLNIIGGRAEFLLRRPRSEEDLSQNLQIIRSQIDRITRIVRQLLEFSRRREPAFRSLELLPLLNKVIRLLEHKILDRGINVKIQIPETLPAIQADPDQLQQVFINLFLNSLQALEPGGTIKISASTIHNGNGNGAGSDNLGIEFEDNGGGIPAEHLSHVFDPFFTTKDVGEGTGLGLSVSYGIIKDHGGEIRVESQPGRFTRFIISLPARGHRSHPLTQPIAE